MTALRMTAAAVAIFVTAACSIGKPIPTVTTFSVEPPLPPPAAMRRSGTLRIGDVRVAPAFSGNALVYRLDDVRYTADFYNAFIAEPADLLGGKIAGWLQRAGPFQVVAQPDARVPASFVLDAAVTELYGDFRPGRMPEAVMTIQFILVDVGGIRPRSALERSISRRVGLAEDSPEALVRGYGQALGEILTELAPQLAGGSAQ